MKPWMLLAGLLAFAPAVFAQKSITLEDVWERNTFAPKGVPGFSFSADGVHYTRLAGNRLDLYDIRTGNPAGVLAEFGGISDIASYTFSGDEQQILLATASRPIYRWSTEADYYVFNRKTSALMPVRAGVKVRSASFSPDGRYVAYVWNNNLYYRPVTADTAVAVTTDGVPNQIINGVSDWVYEEEFEIVQAYAWSPDGRYIAFLRFDERAVPEMALEYYRNEAYPDVATYKYPKVGEANAVVTAWVYELATASLRPLHLPAGGGDYYLPRLVWTPDGTICVTWMNRLQNHLRLLITDPATGVTHTLFEEKHKAYLELEEPIFLPDRSGFLWPSSKNGYRHLYRYNMQGREENAITRGDWDVTEIYGYDDKQQQVFFQAASRSPMQREIYSININGKKLRKLSEEAGYHTATFSKTFEYWIDGWSTINIPPQYQVKNKAGKLIRLVELNTALSARQKEYGVRPAEFFSFKTEDNVPLNGFTIRPEAAGQNAVKYPVLMFVYGGPGSQQVLDIWKGPYYWWFQMLVQQGFVVVCVDNRGTGGRGEGFKKMTYGQLGHFETIDQINAARHVGTWSYVDSTRIGIFGWSYGGYLSSLCLLKGNDVFRAAVAVAPVTNWKWYDSVYTERYMGLYNGNEEGYEKNSPVNFAARLKGEYLLAHGLADDNVHFQHAAEMSNQLIAENKQFDAMFYPNRHHGISGGKTRLHLFTKITDFLKSSLITQP